MARLQRRNRIKGKQAFSSILPLRGELQCQSKTLRFFACSKSTGILILITPQNQQISNERWNEQEHSYCASLADAAQSKANKPFAAALSGYFQCSMKVGHNGNRCSSLFLGHQELGIRIMPKVDLTNFLRLRRMVPIVYGAPHVVCNSWLQKK